MTDAPAGTPPPTPPVTDVAGLLWDEFEALHGPRPQPPGGAPGPVTLDDELRTFHAHVHALPDTRGRSALCLSGGGIRSAAFSLGILQALAHAGTLPRFHYLSTVSGGGYIGSWLTAWIHRHMSTQRDVPRSRRLRAVSETLAVRDGLPAFGGDRPPEARQVSHLRRFTNYLSPHTGAFSLDTWTLLAIYLRNLLLNWTVVIPLLLAAVTLPVILNALLGLSLGALRDGWGPRETLLALAGATLGAWLVFVAVALYLRDPANPAVSEDYSRAEGNVLRIGATALAFTALVLLGPAAVQGLVAKLGVATTGGLSALATWALKKFGDSSRRTGDGTPRSAGALRAATAGAALVTIVAIVLLLSWAIAMLAAWITARTGWHPALAAPAVLVAALLVSALAAWAVGINDFSLHALYRNRLVRGFLRASRTDDDATSDKAFSAADDLPLKDLWPSRVDWTDPCDRPYLFPVVNATLNDLGGTRPEWNERKGVSFTFSPLHAGAHIAGRYRDAADATAGRGGYRRLRDDRADPLRLGTAMSISGAAASPNMGYHSSPSVSFLMALFNVRLGWWMGRPWEPGDDLTLRGRNPFTVWQAWAAEAFGGTRLTSSLLNVSDGGHFDNLGLYEMVRRRCRYLVVIDAGQDAAGGFDALGEAIRKIRVDFGVPITMSGLDLSAAARVRQDDGKPAHAWFGTVHYSWVDERAGAKGERTPAADGVLVYVKPAVTGDEPLDVQAYRRMHPAFPHESTGDQWFSESQFESYRALGYHSVRHMLDYYEASKGVVRGTRADRTGRLTPGEFCHRAAEAIALMRRHSESSTHAGGVVFSRRPDHALQFLLVRSADQLTRVLPKGFIEPWEDAPAAAMREVREEAGVDAYPVRSLGIRSFDTPARRVTTTYFLMEGQDPDVEPRPHEDLREPRWLTLAQARDPKANVPADVVQVLELAAEVIETEGGNVAYAGGVVFARADDETLYFLMVPSADGARLGFPCDELQPGEPLQETARRIVRELADLDTRAGGRIADVTLQRGGRPARAVYFLMARVPWPHPARRPTLHGPARSKVEWCPLETLRSGARPLAEEVRGVLDEAERAIDNCE